MYKNYCRICGLKRSQENVIFFVSLFAEDCDGEAELTKHATMFGKCLFELNPSDEGPRYLCGACKIKLSQFHEFRKKALETNELFLRKIGVTIDLDTSINHTTAPKESLPEVKFEGKKDEEMFRINKENDWYDNMDEVSLNSFESHRNETDDIGLNINEPLKLKDQKLPHVLEICTAPSTSDLGILQNTRNIPNKQRFSCKYCPMEFTLSSVLRVHELSHSSLIERPCPHCNSTFQTEQNLKNHINRKHTNKSELMCDICGNWYSHRTSLIRHFRAIHFYDIERKYNRYLVKRRQPLNFKESDCVQKKTKPRPYVCKFCGKTFPNPSQLLKHESRHTDLRLASCNYCGMRFKVEIDLKQHIRRHENKRRFMCDICGKAYKEKIVLKTHIKTNHTNTVEIHECQYCLQRLKTKGSLNSHVLRNHLNAGKYVCLVCDTGFGWSTDLKRHVDGHVKKGLIKDYEATQYMKIDIKKRNV